MIASLLLLVPTALAVPPDAAPPKLTSAPVLQDDPKKEYERRRKEAGKDVEALWELYLWCDAYGLGKEARSCLRAILKQDDAHRPAHEALGHVYFDGQWFNSERELEKYKKKEEERLAKEQGLVKYENEWVPAEDVPYLERGMVRGDDGRWMSREDYERIQSGWLRQDLVWVSPEEVENIEKGLWKCGDKWVDAAEADRYHAYVERWWVIPTERFVVHTTCDRKVAEQAIEVMDRAYRELQRIFDRTPEGPLPVVLLRDTRQYGRFAAGEEGMTPPTEGRGLSSVHHACFADLWRAPDLPETYGAGVGVWDTASEETSAFGPFAARHAAGLSFVEALDPSPKTLEKVAKKGAAELSDVESFWDEKRLPEWLRYGAAAYAERYYVDNTVAQGGNPFWMREWSVENISRRDGLDPLGLILDAHLTVDDTPGSEKRINERGLVVAFIVDGGCAPVSAAHEELKAAMREGKDPSKAISNLEKQVRAHEAEFRKFAGI